MKSRTDVPPEPGTDDSRSTDDLQSRKDRQRSKSQAERGLRNDLQQGRDHKPVDEDKNRK